MKKFNLILILMLGMTMGLTTSCSSDDDSSIQNTSINVADVVGTWMCTESTDTYQGHSTEDLMVGKQVTLKSDSTYTSTASSFGQSGTWSLYGNKVTANSSAGTFVLTVTITGRTMHWYGTASNGVTFDYYFDKE